MLPRITIAAFIVPWVGTAATPPSGAPTAAPFRPPSTLDGEKRCGGAGERQAPVTAIRILANAAPGRSLRPGYVLFAPQSLLKCSRPAGGGHGHGEHHDPQSRRRREDAAARAGRGTPSLDGGRGAHHPARCGGTTGVPHPATSRSSPATASRRWAASSWSFPCGPRCANRWTSPEPPGCMS